ncbi:chorismate-binding protein [Actinotalea sp. K2]|uniref:chorismate-binding protein n=1 Tax=Actinotalea sp. K2 TaxID=2939438 RepID=UPI002017D683|nr:chorismate-binding protein [Actinotalea sp. K2]MCL3862300.1 chorismate-binding protein [Actinotalea sp. K2]
MPADPLRRASGTARFAGISAVGAVECIDLRTESHRLDGGGFWAVVGDFEGRVRAWRFAEVERDPESVPVDRPGSARAWTGPPASTWASSLGSCAYQAAVTEIRRAIRSGDVYQVNLCRVLQAPLAALDGREPDPEALTSVLARGNPAPYSGLVHVPGGRHLPPVWVVTASPELFLRVEGGLIASGPIKGTASTPAGLTDKDRAENIMIVDLVRNDLQQVCVPGTVEVVGLLEVEQHPGLVHLVSTVQGRLVSAMPPWGRILDATYPPASVSGAPKRAAVTAIERLEPVPRGPYCGAVGWIDADSGRAEIAVGIRTFWWTAEDGGLLRFGTGAGITWGSDPAAEWAETELKADRLIGLASAPG